MALSKISLTGNAIENSLPVSLGGTGVTSASNIGNLRKIATAYGTAQTGVEFSAKPETDNAHLTCTVSTDGSSFHNSGNNYKYGYQHIYADGTAHDVIYSNGATSVEMSKDAGNDTSNAESWNVIMRLRPIDVESSVKQSNNWTWEGCRFDSSNNFREIRGSASLEATYVLKMNKISIAPNTGNFEDYFYTLWGYYDG
jgi:hypothetical protein